MSTRDVQKVVLNRVLHLLPLLLLGYALSRWFWVPAVLLEWGLTWSMGHPMPIIETTTDDLIWWTVQWWVCIGVWSLIVIRFLQAYEPSRYVSPGKGVMTDG